jgi:hypothetical protein
VFSLCHECSEIPMGRGSTYCYIPNQQNAVEGIGLQYNPSTISFKVSPKKFRCVCFVHNISLSTSKLDTKSYKCVFVGYSSGKKGINVMTREEEDA